MDNLFLSYDEVAFLTGRERAKAQIKQLERQKIAFKLNAAGRPIVLRDVLVSSKSKNKEQQGWQSNKR